MFINKTGSYHTENELNNQDSGFDFKQFNCVVDGCSEGKHSEVGAKLFTKKLLDLLLLRYKFIDTYPDSQDKVSVGIHELVEIFEKVLVFVTAPQDLYSINLPVAWRPYEKYVSDIRDNMLFTILFLREDDYGWDMFICGDGYVITQDQGDNIEFHDIDHAPAPMYLAYAYVRPDSLDLKDDEKKLLRNRPFKVFRYYKKDYKAIGIASDGIRYIIGTEYEEKFKDLLIKRKDFLVKRFINKLNYDVRKIGGSGFFKDDITISMR